MLALLLLIPSILTLGMHKARGRSERAAEIQARSHTESRSKSTITAVITSVSIYTPPSSPDPITVTEYTSVPGTTTLF